MPDRHDRRLLTLDAIINLCLGLVLLGFANAAISLLGLPLADTDFYVTLLGAILLGIGLALWIERRNNARRRGLGLAALSPFTFWAWARWRSG